MAPKNVKVLLDNEQVRVYEEHYAPGDKIGIHTHPAYVVYVLKGGKIRLTSPNGNVTERKVSEGKAIFNDPLRHTSEWLGPGEGRLLVVELKRAPNAAH